MSLRLRGRGGLYRHRLWLDLRWRRCHRHRRGCRLSGWGRGGGSGSSGLLHGWFVQTGHQVSAAPSKHNSRQERNYDSAGNFSTRNSLYSRTRRQWSCVAAEQLLGPPHPTPASLYLTPLPSFGLEILVPSSTKIPSDFLHSFRWLCHPFYRVSPLLTGI